MRNIKLLASIVAVLAMIVSCDKPALVAPNENQEQNDNKDESANTNGLFCFLQGYHSFLSSDVQVDASISHMV